MITTTRLQQQATHATEAAATLTLAIAHIERATQDAEQAVCGIAVIDQLAETKRLLRKSITKLETRRRRLLRKLDRLPKEEPNDVR